MRTRIVAIVGAAAVALGLIGLVLLALTYNGSVLNRPDDSEGSVLGLDQPAQPTPETTVAPPSASELASMATMDQFIDECMADAGFPEFIVVNVWDPDYVPTEPWDAGLSADRAAAAVLAQWGNPAGGADYRWEDAGCQGYGTHQIGADNAN